MSARSDSHAGERTVDIGIDGAFGPGSFRLLACCCVLVLTASYVNVLREVTSVVGGTRSLLTLVAVVLVAATVLAWTIRPRTAIVGAVAAGALGFAYYFESSGVGVGVVLSAGDTILSDTFALVTGLPLLRMIEAGVWTLAFVPTPVFLSWYLAVRGRYGLAVVPGGFALFFLVLTGDAGTTVTLVGTLAALGAIGFGELERRGGSIAQADLLAACFAVMIVLSLTITVLPEGSGSTGQFSGSAPGTLEGTIDYSGERSGIGGSVELSPEVRFTVESEQPSYWRTGVYDRFTGDEWYRTGETSAYDGTVSTPPGEYDRVRQVVTAETDLGVMPTAPQPLTLDGDLARHAEVTRHGQVHPTTPVLEGDSYAVESAILDADASELRTAGTNYPTSITDEGDYLQTPEGTSDEFDERTAEVTADAETPYDKASVIEAYLRSSKDYSLEVDRPDGNVAEEFLLEMDEGYCVYFATTMVQMLRAEDVPARYVTGYTTGQRVDDDEYVVRGTDAHAWVEVYFPGQGWVSFDPTPSDRDATHTERVEQARAAGSDGVDTDSSADAPLSEEGPDSETGDESGPDDPTAPDESDRNGSESNTDPDEDDGSGADGSDSDSDSDDPDPSASDESASTDGGDGNEDGLWRALVEFATVSRETAAIGLVAIAGLVAGVHRTNASARVRRTLGLYWQRRSDDPDRDVERAYRRLERLLAREYRPRERSESARGHLEALEAVPDRSIDPRVGTVVDRYERARYAGGITRAEADEAVELVDELAREHLPVVGRRSN